MRVGLLLITHNQIGHQMMLMATTTLGEIPINYEIISVDPDESLDQVTDRANSSIKRLDQGDGVLVITDLYGATPGNIACRLLGHANIRVITGLNLPMLLKVANYATHDLDSLTQKALLGAKRGIVLCNQDICQVHRPPSTGL